MGSGPPVRLTPLPAGEFEPRELLLLAGRNKHSTGTIIRISTHHSPSPRRVRARLRPVRCRTPIARSECQRRDLRISLLPARPPARPGLLSACVLCLYVRARHACQPCPRASPPARPRTRDLLPSIMTAAWQASSQFSNTDVRAVIRRWVQAGWRRRFRISLSQSRSCTSPAV